MNTPYLSGMSSSLRFDLDTPIDRNALLQCLLFPRPRMTMLNMSFPSS